MNLGELRTALRSLAQVDSNRLPDAEADLFLQEASDAVCDGYRLRFCEELIETAFIADQVTITPASSRGVVRVPTDMWYADASSGKRQMVTQISWAEYVDKYGTAATDPQGTGSPVHFAIHGESDDGHPVFYLGPIPSADRSPVFLDARIGFILTDATDENRLSITAPLAILYKACVLASPFLEEDDTWEAMWDRRYNDVVKRLLVSHGAARRGAKHARSMEEP